MHALQLNAKLKRRAGGRHGGSPGHFEKLTGTSVVNLPKEVPVRSAAEVAVDTEAVVLCRMPALQQLLGEDDDEVDSCRREFGNAHDPFCFANLLKMLKWCQVPSDHDARERRWVH
mmetsp:Transcript_74403/g.174619  ORF Transcript_74403/g.174619 Transcript_74403/m.174619 type:complete len:116 (+) Transcript_74403:318-665(+)